MNKETVNEYKMKIGDAESIEEVMELNLELNGEYEAEVRNMDYNQTDSDKISSKRSIADIKTLLNYCQRRSSFLSSNVSQIRNYNFRHLSKLLLTKDDYDLLSKASAMKFRDGEVMVKDVL